MESSAVKGLTKLKFGKLELDNFVPEEIEEMIIFLSTSWGPPPFIVFLLHAVFSGILPFRQKQMELPYSLSKPDAVYVLEFEIKHNNN